MDWNEITPELKKIIERYLISPEVKNVVICIGTNDRYKDLGVGQLVNLICVKFPNSKIYVVQGSWGWGGIRKITYPKVKKYYTNFERLGVTVIETPIGKREPHRDCLIYKQIGKEIDSLLYL